MDKKYVSSFEIENNIVWCKDSDLNERFFASMKGKKILFLGDSLVWGDVGDAGHTQVEIPYPVIFERITGSIVTNGGIKGATFTTKSPFNLYNSLLSYKLEDYDYLFISYGINDFYQQSVIGDTTSLDNDTVYGSLNKSIAYINEKNPRCIIYLCNIPFIIADKLNAINGYRAILDSYRDVIKNISLSNNVKYIDLFNCGINGYNISSFSHDGVHYTQEGYYLIAYKIVQSLGGDTPLLTTYQDKWNKNMYYSKDKVGRYYINVGGVDTGYNSWNEITLKKGIYEIAFKYNAECGEYDKNKFFSAIHMKINDDFIVSPLGIDNGTGYIRVKTYIDKDVSGILKFSYVSDKSDIGMSKLYIEDVEIRTDAEVIIKNTYTLPIGFNMTGNMQITRSADGSVSVSYTGQSTNSKNEYAVLYQGTALLPYDNMPVTLYSNGCVNVNNTRTQMLNNIVGCSSKINANDYVTFNFTVHPIPQ